MAEWKVPQDPRRSLGGKLARRDRMVAARDFPGLGALDQQIDALYRAIDEREGRVYVPRFRQFESLSETKLNEVAAVLRLCANKEPNFDRLAREFLG